MNESTKNGCDEELVNVITKNELPRGKRTSSLAFTFGMEIKTYIIEHMTTNV